MFIGAVRVSPAAEYGLGGGFVIEQFGYYNGVVPMWAIPAWEERGMEHLAETFATREAANTALRDT